MIKKIQKYQKKNPYAPMIIKKNGELTAHAITAIRESGMKGRKIYPVDYAGSGRHITVRDRSAYIIMILNACGYKYEQGNDAPRGGAAGNFIKVSSKNVIDRIVNLINQ